MIWTLIIVVAFIIGALVAFNGWIEKQRGEDGNKKLIAGIGAPVSLLALKSIFNAMFPNAGIGNVQEQAMTSSISDSFLLRKTKEKCKAFRERTPGAGPGPALGPRNGLSKGFFFLKKEGPPLNTNYNHSSEEIRRCATNSATDSEMKGLFGVSGDAYVIPIIGVFVSTLLYFHLINDPHSHPNSIESLAVVLAPALSSFGYVFYFIVNRPKRFRHDWLDGVLNGPNYNHLARRPIRHPFEKVRNKTKRSQQKSLT